MYLFYIRVRSFLAHHHESLNSLPPSTSKSLQLVFATILALYGGYFTFFITLLTAVPAIKLFAWTPMNEWYDKVKNLISGTDKKLRLDQEIIEWVEDQAYSDGIALYLSKSGIVRKFLHLIIAECESEILWGLFRVIFVCSISIFLVFWSALIRNVMMTVFMYGTLHDMVFQSYLFHNLFYESFQSKFKNQYAHWSKIAVEARLFKAIFIYILLVSWIAGSFGSGMSITFGCYLIVRNTVSNKYQPYNYGDSKSEYILIASWLFFFSLSLFVQWRLF